MAIDLQSRVIRYRREQVFGWYYWNGLPWS